MHAVMSEHSHWDPKLWDLKPRARGSHHQDSGACSGTLSENCSLQESHEAIAGQDIALQSPEFLCRMEGQDEKRYHVPIDSLAVRVSFPSHAIPCRLVPIDSLPGVMCVERNVVVFSCNGYYLIEIYIIHHIGVSLFLSYCHISISLYPIAYR